MKLKKDFITHDMENESLLIPTGASGFSGIVKGNSTFGAIVALLENETTEAAVIDAMCKEYDAPRELIAEDVKKAVECLRGIGALDE